MAAWSVATAFPSIGAQDSATLANTVSVPGAPVPCMTLSNAALVWGELGFAGPGDVTASAGALILVTDCSGVSQSLLVAGTPATAKSVTWSLNGPIGVLPCDLGTNNYGVNVVNGLSGVFLEAAYQPLGSIGDNLPSDVVVNLWMPCQGSDGEGKTMTFDINFLVTIP